MTQFSPTNSSEPQTVKDSEKHPRILLGQLGSNGDCLYATTIARQIKHDYPGCHLTWAIGSMYRHILDGNPDVDEIWEIPLTKPTEMVDTWQRFEAQALERKKIGDFDEIFLTQIAPNNLHNYDGTIRSSIFRAYPRSITVPIAPVLRLSSREVANVCSFAKTHLLLEKEHVILFECAPKSGQSFVTPDFALEVSQKLLQKASNACIILSSNLPIPSANENIIDGSVLSLRETAELTKYCSLLVGGSSGISWISTSDWAKPLPMVQLIEPNSFWFASVIHDYKYWGLNTDHIIEITNELPEKIVDCLIAILVTGFCEAKLLFHEHIPVPFDSYVIIVSQFLRQQHYGKAVKLLRNNIHRHGFVPQLIWKPVLWLLKALIKKNNISQ
jgi:hypothetical protein